MGKWSAGPEIRWALKTLMAILGMPAGSCRRPLGKMSRNGVETVLAIARQVQADTPGIFKPLADFFKVDIDDRLNNEVTLLRTAITTPMHNVPCVDDIGLYPPALSTARGDYFGGSSRRLFKQHVFQPVHTEFQQRQLRRFLFFQAFPHRHAKRFRNELSKTKGLNLSML